MPDPEGSAGPVAGPGAPPEGSALARLVPFGLLAVVAAAGALLLGPVSGQPLPTSDRLGQPAQATLRADRDYELEDTEATARRRAAAAAAIRPVYDEDASAGEEAAARVRAAFASMREAAADFRRQRPGASAAELDRHLTAERDAFVSRLQVVASDEDLAALVAARFPEGAERSLEALVRRGLEGPLVGDRALLPAGREAGLVVRAFRSGEVGGVERQLLDLAPIRDLATARAELLRGGAAEVASLPPGPRAAVLRLAGAALHPTLVFNQGETERRRAEAAGRVRPAFLLVRRGERIVAAGERLEPLHLAVVEAMRAQAQGEDRGRIRLGGAAVLALLVALLWRFGRGALPRFRPGPRDAALLAFLLLLGLALAAAGVRAAALVAEALPGVPREGLVGLLPLAAGALVARQVLSSEAALLLAMATSAATALLGGPSLALALHAGITSLAVAGLSRPGRRTGLLAGGAAAGLAGALTSAGLALQAGRPLSDVLLLSGAALAGGVLLVPALAWPLVVLAERGLGYLTQARLERLANLNHPALKELIVQAPGTYHHSILTGTLAEAAARAIGADPLLARVGAYYHDLGKSRAPLLFAENQRTRNEHEKLDPAASAALIVRHVADGLELARRHRLPRAVREIVAQHHGTRRVGYFWAKQQKWEESGAGEVVEEAAFRYPGPRPRRREAALVMLADACEASARALEGPTPAQLRAVVERRVAEAAAEGQLLECELTMGELDTAARALAEALVGLYRDRPAAPLSEPGAPVIHLKARQ